MVSCCGRSAWRPVMYGLAAVMEYYYRSASTRRGWISGVASRSPCEAKMRVSMDRRLPAIVRSWRAVERRSISQLSPSIGCSIIETRCIPEIRGGRRGWRILTGHGTSVRDPFSDGKDWSGYWIRQVDCFFPDHGTVLAELEPFRVGFVR